MCFCSCVYSHVIKPATNGCQCGLPILNHDRFIIRFCCELSTFQTPFSSVTLARSITSTAQRVCFCKHADRQCSICRRELQPQVLHETSVLHTVFHTKTVHTIAAAAALRKHYVSCAQASMQCLELCSQYWKVSALSGGQVNSVQFQRCFARWL